MDYEKLKEVIAKQIKENGKREITGPVLQAVLMAMVDSLGEVYPHTYTDEEKAQARANIDALSNHNGEITKEKLSLEVQAILNDVANKQNISDATLATIAKTIVGAINEVYKGGLEDASIATSKIKDGAITEPKLDTDLINVITSAVQPAELASAIATALTSYVAKADIVDTTGSATDKVMSQHGVTEAIDGVTNKVTELESKTLELESKTLELGFQSNSQESLISDIYKGQDNLSIKRGFSFSDGGLNTLGNIAFDGKTFHSEKLSTTQESIVGAIVNDSTKFKVDVLYYNGIDDTTAYAETGFLASSSISLYRDKYIRINVRKIDESAISEEELVSIYNTIFIRFSFVSNIPTKEYVSDEIENKTKDFLKMKAGKNLFNKDSTEIQSGYKAYADGITYTNPDFEFLIIEIKGNTTYCVTPFSYFQIAFFNGQNGYISGLNNTECETFTTPSNAVKMSVSYPKTRRDSIQVEEGSVATEYVPYSYGILGTDIQAGAIDESRLSTDIVDVLKSVITTKTIVVDINGSGDYVSLRDALESITDASEFKRYEVLIKEGTYNIRSYYTDAEWSVEGNSFIGLVVPDYVTLIGLGNKENVILTASDTTQRTYISTLNLSNTCGLKNLSIKADGLRYTIHDDFASTKNNGYERLVENCYFYGVNLKLNYTYGCGIKQGANFVFKNCVFETVGAIPGLLIHNNVGWDKESYVRVENCRFIPYSQNYNNNKGILFSSLGTNSKFTYATIIGCAMRRIELNENNAAVFGKGNMFKVNGYGNKFVHAGPTAGEDDVFINTTDGVDYSSYVDLI